MNFLFEPPIDAVDEMRIVAKDARGLCPADRKAIIRGTEELEECRKMLVSTQAALIEAQQRCIAMNEQLIEARKKLVPHPFVGSVSASATFLLETRHASATCP